jgi:hypothetical protein
LVGFDKARGVVLVKDPTFTKVHLDCRKGWQSKAGYDGPRESRLLLLGINVDGELNLHVER